MRNLKKILALVLALIMSLSLMATASATEFPDDGDINDTYRVAVEVLSGLNVFAGDQNGKFNPGDPIRRSEVAAIIYRIATGDVTNERNDSYTPYNQFSDVIAGDWFAGYVTYCANAGYIKGRSDGKFDPYANVTGYEVLAMILRAVGYDKNNEFVGSNWQINTASIATEKKVLKNITSTTQLSEPATRETVAELLFQSILLPKVTWNSNSLSYVDSAEKVCDVLKLEEIEGVVIANEWASLDDNYPLANGKTKMLVDGKNYNLDYSTDLTDMGESRLAYIQNGSKVLYLADTGKNAQTYENEGAWKDLNGASRFRSATNLSYDDNTEWYQNFNPGFKTTSDWKITYTVDAEWWPEFREVYTGNGYIAETPRTIQTEVKYIDENGDVKTRLESHLWWVVEIKPGEEIESIDITEIRRIFDWADKTNSEGYLIGEVYVGTQSNVDVSDTKSYTQFVADYLKDSNKSIITWADTGEWFKAVDNDNDGVAEYVFLTDSHLDQVARITTKDGKTEYTFYGVTSIDENLWNYYGFRFVENGKIVDTMELGQGEKVLWSFIDGYYYIEKVNVETGIVQVVNYDVANMQTYGRALNDNIVTSEGTTYTQSWIYNDTRLPGALRNAEKHVEYRFYKDHFGYVRAYEPVNGNQYVLLTEAYSTNTDNGVYLKNWVGIVEHKIGDAAIANATVANFNGSFERGNNLFFQGTHQPIEDSRYQNFLTGAKQGLGLTDVGTYGYTVPSETNAGGTRTNVAVYTKDSDGRITINSAAQQLLRDNGNRVFYTYPGTDNINLNDPVMVRDYVAIDSNQKISGAVYKTVQDVGHEGGTDGYVHAAPTTEYYLVSKDGVRYFTGYSNLPAIEAKYIDAAYAVATNDYAVTHATGAPYWVADVVVIELNANWTTGFENIDLIIANHSKNWDTVYDYTAIDRNSRGQLNFSSVKNWAGQDQAPVFVGTTGGKKTAEDTTDIRDITPITPSYLAANGKFFRDFGIYAATISTMDLTRGYITLNPDNGIYEDYDGIHEVYANNAKDVTLSITDVPVYTVYGGVAKAYTLNQTVWNNNLSSVVRYGNEGDRIIYVKNGSNVAFIVMVTVRDTLTGDRQYNDYSYAEYNHVWYEQGQLQYNSNTNKITDAYNNLWWQIVADQGKSAPAAATTFGTFYDKTFGIDGAGNKVPADGIVTVTYNEALNALVNWKINDNSGYTFTLSNPVELSETEVQYTVTAQKGDKSYTFTLIQQAASGNELTVGNYIKDIDANNNITIDVRSNTTISDFITSVEKNNAPANAKLVWNFVDETGKEILEDEWDTIHMDSEDIGAWSVTVWSESGKANTYYGVIVKGTPVAAVYVRVNPYENIDLSGEPVLTKLADGSYTIQVISEQEPVVVLENGDVYKMTKGEEARVAYLWTAEIPATAVERIIYIRLLQANDKPIPPTTEEPSEVPVVPSEEIKDLITVDTEKETITINKDQEITVGQLVNGLTNEAGEKVTVVIKDAEGNEITDETAKVEAGFTVTVTDGDKSADYKVEDANVEVPEEPSVEVKLVDADGSAITDETIATVGEGTLTEGTYTAAVTIGEGYKATATADDEAAVVTLENGTLTVTNVTKATVVTITVVEDGGEIEVPELLPYKAELSTGTYTLYSYKQEKLTDEQVKIAIAAITEGVNAADITLIDAGTDISVVANGKQLGSFAKTSQTTPNALFQVSLNGTAVDYVKNNADKAKGFVGEKYVLLSSNAPANTTGGTVNAEGVATIAAVAADVNYLSAVKVLIGDGLSKTSVKVVDDYGNAGSALDATSGLYILTGKTIQVEQAAAPTAGDRVQIYAGEEAVGEPKVAPDTNKMTFDIAVEAGEDGTVTYSAKASRNIIINGQPAGTFTGGSQTLIDAALGLAKDDVLIPVGVSGETAKYYAADANKVVVNGIGSQQYVDLSSVSTYNPDGDIELVSATKVTADDDYTAKVLVDGEATDPAALSTATIWVASVAELELTSSEAQTYLVAMDEDENVIASGTADALLVSTLKFTVGDKALTIAEINAPFTLAINATVTKDTTTGTDLGTAISSACTDITGTVAVAKDDVAVTNTALTSGTYVITITVIEAAEGSDLSNLTNDALITSTITGATVGTITVTRDATTNLITSITIEITIA